MNKKILLKVSLELSRLLVGFTFLFSGFVKAIDPRGFAYKIEDYFSAFNLSMLDSLALPISVALCVIEFALGVFALLGIYRKWTTRLLLLVMLFMTPLTLYLALVNPVSDCGCFGDALVITNWETFWKNVILLACTVFLYFNPEKLTNIFTGKTYWLTSFYVYVFITFFAIYNIVKEPIVDFRPYAIGANLRELALVPEGEGDVVENTFFYQKDGVIKEFTEDNYPWQDSTWQFVKMESEIVKEGAKSEIADFSINYLPVDSDGDSFMDEEDITESVLYDDSYSFLMITYSLLDMGEANISQFEDVYNYAQEKGYNFYVLTASLKDDILRWKRDNAVDFEFCLTDERVLKTIMRSNPGMLVLKDGVVINKWTGFEVPDESALTASGDSLLQGEKTVPSKIYMKASLVFFVPLLLLLALDASLYRRKQKKTKEEESK